MKLSSFVIVLLAAVVLSACSRKSTVVAPSATPASPAAIAEPTPTLNEVGIEGAMEDEGVVTDKGGIKEFIVDGNDFSFSEKVMKVKKGDTVRVVFNNKKGFHDWVIDEFNAKTKQIKAGESETIEFIANQVGTFEYYCSVGQHRKAGMVGNLIVE